MQTKGNGLDKPAMRKNRCRGLTIIQIMFFMLAIGIVGSIAVDFIIDMRCATDASSTLCKKEAASQ